MNFFKYMKPFIFMVITIVFLLFLQANCELSLPSYMSSIVNTGIQQGGIESNVPTVIRESEYNKIILLTKEDNKEKIKERYEKIDIGDRKYMEEYPILKEESVYVLVGNEDGIKEIIIKPLSIILAIESGNIPMDSFDIPSDKTLFDILSVVPQEQLEGILEGIYNNFDGMPESIVDQAAISYVKNEYSMVGINVVDIQKNYIINTGLLMIAIAFISMIASVSVGFIASKISAKLGRNLRNDVFENVSTFSNEEFNKFGASSLITRTTNDIQQVQNMMVFMLRIIFYAPILGIGGFFKVLQTDSSMSWIVALALGVILFVVISFFIFAVPKFKIVQSLIDKLNLVTREFLTGIMVIRAFNTEKHEEKKFDTANKNLMKTNLFINRTMSLLFPLMMLIMNCVVILIIWIGAHQIDKGFIQVGDMMAFVQYTMQIISSFLMITMLSINIPRAAVSIGRIMEVLNLKTSISNPENPKHFSEIKGIVKFKKVFFKYKDADDYVLDNISFEAKPGTTTAFIGSTGSGKSTLLNLIPRFYDVTDGSITIDGTDIRDVNKVELRDNIGYIPQKGILFSGTIRSNLLYGKNDASDKELDSAASIAQARSFIEAKEGKYDYHIAQGGTNVSGGQKQRLSIARALVKKPKVYIFDDTFSALDFKTDSNLRKALNKKVKDATVLVVAQRISTILNAEQIIVLDKGKIVGKGTHKELMKKCKVYKEIALSQLSKEELA